MKPVLTIKELIDSAYNFCNIESRENHIELIGVTDGKAVGTYVEHKFQRFLREQYVVDIGSSAKGIDLPGESILTDIKVTSITQPQSSCPFKSARQKIFGLGYNLLVFVYDKNDTNDSCTLHFTHCTFIDKERTADFTITKRLREMVNDGANKEDIIGFLQDKNVPGDEIVYSDLADEILVSPPMQGYLTISNALQWRLQYARVIELNNCVKGVINYEWQT
ncbi:MAG: restriction endonuclease [Eubacterium sp.]|nr:restriction endonuclease [Eubacterium sp.]